VTARKRGRGFDLNPRSLVCQFFNLLDCFFAFMFGHSNRPKSRLKIVPSAWISI
jgi:hypothetical protein